MAARGTKIVLKHYVANHHLMKDRRSSTGAIAGNNFQKIEGYCNENLIGGDTEFYFKCDGTKKVVEFSNIRAISIH